MTCCEDYYTAICLDGTGPGAEFPPRRSLDGGAKTQPFLYQTATWSVSYETNYGQSKMSLITSMKYVWEELYKKF